MYKRQVWGRLIVNILGSVAQWEREAIGERTSEALQAKRAPGERAGNLPYGYTADADGMLVEDESEQSALARMREMRESGATLQAVADAMNAEGYRTRRGGGLTKQGISQVLKRAQA